MMVPPRPHILCGPPTGTSKKRTSSNSNRTSPVSSRSTSPAKSVAASSGPRTVPSASQPRPVAATFLSLPAAGSKHGLHSRPVNSERSVTEPNSKIASSKPMVIPMGKSHSYTTSTSVKTMQPRRTSRRQGDHDPNALPPAVAALLAVTAIPPPNKRAAKLKMLPRRISIEHLREEWKRDVSAASSFKNGSPLDFLLEPADGSDMLLLGDDDGLSMTMTSRSVSSESITSTPSLEADMSTYSSRCSTPSTPLAYLRRPSRMVERKVSSPPAEECREHPLLFTPIPEDCPLPPNTPLTIAPSQSSKPRSTFKSNLTASFQALRSAAKAFSNFTAPSLPSDDMLTRSLFSSAASSSRYATEMRPRNFGAHADPALRRYLNPPPPLLSSPDFPALITDALAAHDPDPSLMSDATPMIQMTTYSRGGRSSKKSSFRGEAGDRDLSIPVQRQREPRENSDFLRVIVLEMNMRRTGKLDAKAAGRARVWLPPRKAGENSKRGKSTGVGRVVPIRWVGITAGSDEEG